MHVLVGRPRALALLMVLVGPGVVHGECVPAEGLAASGVAAQTPGQADEVAERWFEAAAIFEKALSTSGCQQDELLLYNSAEATRRGLEASSNPQPRQVCRMVEHYRRYLAVSQDQALKAAVKVVLAQFEGGCPPIPLPEPVDQRRVDRREAEIPAGGEVSDEDVPPDSPGDVQDSSLPPVTEGKTSAVDAGGGATAAVGGGGADDGGPKPTPEPVERDDVWIVGGSLALLAAITAGAGGYYLALAVESTDQARAIADSVDCDATASHPEAVRRFDAHAADAKSERLLGAVALGAGLAIGGVATWWFLRDPDPPTLQPQIATDPRAGTWTLGVSGHF